ncbi:MAG: hypothetical protein JJE28_00040 [Actinomycetales bacterium]|nr:hypothetical protein [Actinomycetales bacterium]
MDDDVLITAGKLLDMDGPAFQAGLLAATKKCLGLNEPGRAIFTEFDRAIKWWSQQKIHAQRQGKPAPPPPIIGLLALFTLAAERMGQTNNSEIHQSAYYPQLYQLLEVHSADQSRFETGFRDSSERYWDCLGLWLEGEDGEFGLPSAYALSHRFIGLPISQALIRDTERKQLRQMFADMSLPYGQGIGHGDMDSALDSWITQLRSPASQVLQNLWTKDSRARITDIAITELEAWDGTGGETTRGIPGAESATAKCLLAATEVPGFFSTDIQLGFVFPFSSNAEPETEIQTTEGYVDIQVVQIGSNLRGSTAEAASISAKSLLEGDLNLRLGGGKKLRRLPRLMVPLYRDSVSGIWIESDRVHIGETGRLLVEDSSKMVSTTRIILDSIARPGFRLVVGPDGGIPVGWVEFADVQVLKAPSQDEVFEQRGRYNPLMPRLGTRLSFTDGFRLPGNVTRWSSLAKPSITVTSEDESLLHLVCVPRDSDANGVIAEQFNICKPRTAPFIVPLEGLPIETGDFSIELFSGKKRLQAQTLRIRDSSTRDFFSGRRVRHVAHPSEFGRWPLQASVIGNEQTVVVDGAAAFGGVCDVSEVVPPPAIRWKNSIAVSVTENLLRIPALGGDSCVLTGAHRLKLPTFTGRNESRYMIGVCLTCGMTRRYPTDPRAAERLKTEREISARSGTMASIVDIPSFETSEQPWAAGIDALLYIGAGESKLLEGVARQVENTAVFEQQFSRHLEQLGIIEVVRDDWYQMHSFVVAKKSFAGLSDGSVALTGAWSQSETKRLFSLAVGLGGEVSRLDPAFGCLPLVKGLDIHELGEKLAEPEIAVAPQAGWNILNRLPALGSVMEEMMGADMPGWTSLERFSTLDSRWNEVTSDSTPGAYRIRSRFTSSYLVRTEEDVELGMAMFVDVYLAKHFAAQLAGQPLVAYDARERVLRVPVAADLPGLYGRAAVLCSGRMPVAAPREYSLKYSDITPDFAAALTGRLV